VGGEEGSQPGGEDVKPSSKEVYGGPGWAGREGEFQYRFFDYCLV